MTTLIHSRINDILICRLVVLQCSVNVLVKFAVVVKSTQNGGAHLSSTDIECKQTSVTKRQVTLTTRL